MIEKTFKKGEVIFKQGELGDSFYQVLEGCVGIFAQYGEAEELKLTELGKDQYFGEMAVIESYPRYATAVSLADDTKVLEVASGDVRAYLAGNADNMIALMKHLATRLQELTLDYEDVAGVISEIKESEKKGRSESLKEKIRKHIAAYRARQPQPIVLSAEHLNDLLEESRAKTPAEKLKTYPQGTIICKEGQTIHCMYDIQMGRVGIYKGYGTDKEQKLAELFPDTFFGEIGMLLDEARTATVVALEETTVDVIYREDLDELFEQNPPKVEMILRNLSNRLRSLTNRYTQACALVCEAAENEEKLGQMSPELAEKITNFKASLYD